MIISKSNEQQKERKEMWIREQYKLLKLFEEKNKEEKKDDSKRS